MRHYIRTNKIHVCVVLDRSGSMGSTATGTISGYNEYINGLKADKESDYTVSLIQFDAHGAVAGPELTISYEDKPLAQVPELTPQTYQPRGGTPLYDAIGECVRRTEAKGRAIIIPIITDGEENASKEFNRDSIKALITAKEAEGWTFAFLAANIDSFATANGLGINLNSTSGYAQGNEKALYSNLAQSTISRATYTRTIGVAAANMRSFVGDDQRHQMMAPPASVTTTVTVTPGGQPAAPATFPAASPIPTHLVRKPRAWSVSKPSA